MGYIASKGPWLNVADMEDPNCCCLALPYAELQPITHACSRLTRPAWAAGDIVLDSLSFSTHQASLGFHLFVHLPSLFPSCLAPMLHLATDQTLESGCSCLQEYAIAVAGTAGTTSDPVTEASLGF